MHSPGLKLRYNGAHLVSAPVNIVTLGLRPSAAKNDDRREGVRGEVFDGG